MKKQLISLLALSLTMPILISCGEKPSTSSSSSPTSNSSSSSTVPVIEAYDFSSLADGTFIRNYNSRLGSINIAQNLVTINGTEYKPVYKSGEDFETQISLYANEVVQYTLSFSTFDNENWMGAETIQTKLTDLEGNETLIFPSLKEAQGSYDAFSFDSDYKYRSGTMFFNFQDEFNESVQGYYMGYGSSNFQTYSAYYSKTYLMRYNNEYVLSIDMLDYEDNYLYDSYIVKKDVYDNRIYLSDYWDSNFYASVQFLTYSAFDGTEIVSFSMDKEGITIGEGEKQSYTFIFDDEGQKIQLADGTKLQGTAFGLTHTSKDGIVKEYVYDVYDSTFEGTYSAGNLSYDFNLDWNTYNYALKINGNTVSYSYEIKDHRKSIVATLDQNKYYFVPDRSNKTLKSYTNNEITYLINTSYYDSTFITSFINHVGDEEKKITFSDGNVTYGTLTGTYSYSYNPYEENPYLTLIINGENYTFKIFDESTKAFVLESDSESLYFFNKEKIESLYDDYTEKVSKSLSFNKEKINFNSSDNSYTIKPRYVASSFAYTIGIYFSNDSKHYVAVPSSQTINLYQIVNEQEYFINSYIPTSDALSFVGKYSFQGKYGVESMELKSDGTFYADTANSSNELVPVQYTYSWSKADDVLSLTFAASATSSVSLTYYGTYITVFTNRYVRDYVYNYEGVYTNSEHVIYLNNGSLYVDGTEQTITSFEENDSNETVLKYGSYQATFSTSNNQKQVVVSDGTTTYTATLNNIDLASFVENYTYTLSSIDYSAKFELNTDAMTGHTKYVLTINNYSYDYVFVLRNGYLTMKFSLIGTYVYLYNNGTSNVIEAESSNPVPPAPPII